MAPKLVKSSIEEGAFDVDVDMENVTLTFDEKIAMINTIKLLDEFNKNQGWTRFIQDKQVVLVNIDAKNLEIAKRYSVFGTVKDADA